MDAFHDSPRSSASAPRKTVFSRLRDLTRVVPLPDAVGEAQFEAGLQSREAEMVVTAFRTLVLILALTAPRILGLTGQYEIPEIWLAALACTYNIAAGLSCLKPDLYAMRRIFMVMMDMMLITLWIRLSGQWELFPFYFLVVVVAAMWFRVLGGALAAAFCNFFFLLLWARAVADPEIMRIPAFTTSMALGTLLLFLVGCLVGYIVEIQDKERERRLENQLLVANYQREIDLSSQMQPLLMAQQNHNLPSLEIGVAIKTARELGGGDYIDVIPLDTDKVLLCIADVSGKSVRAQARLPLLKYALRALAPLHHDPAELVMRLNETLAPDLQPELYIAFCCCVIDGSQQSLQWCNAGHISPLRIRTKNGEASVRPLETCGPPLGLFPDREYATRQMRWRPGYQLLFYTDGLSDALSFNNTEDGEEQVRSLAVRLASENERNIDDVAEDFIALAGAALDASNELPERLRAGLSQRLSSLLPQRSESQPEAESGPGHRDDITVVVVRARTNADI